MEEAISSMKNQLLARPSYKRFPLRRVTLVFPRV